MNSIYPLQFVENGGLVLPQLPMPTKTVNLKWRLARCFKSGLSLLQYWKIFSRTVHILPDQRELYWKICHMQHLGWWRPKFSLNRKSFYLKFWNNQILYQWRVSLGGKVFCKAVFSFYVHLNESISGTLLVIIKTKICAILTEPSNIWNGIFKHDAHSEWAFLSGESGRAMFNESSRKLSAQDVDEISARSS